MPFEAHTRVGAEVLRQVTLPKAVILDVGGTLADTERDGHGVGINKAINEAGPDWIAKLHRSKTQYDSQLLSAGSIPLRSCVRRLIQQARGAGIRMAIVTATTSDNVHALLEHALPPGSSAWFQVIAAGDVVAAKNASTRHLRLCSGATESSA